MKRQPDRYHFVGVGGIGMAALAELLHARGCAVTGTDVVAGANVERLRRLGIRVDVGHAADRIGTAEVVVRSSAIGPDNPELVAARGRGLPIVGRGALLAECLRKLDVVAIAGSHGKTTTTAMTAHLLRAAGLDPTSVVGGRVPLPDGDAGPLQLGQSEWAVAEVDESDGSFLAMRPVVAVVTNADPEHLDYYGSRERMLDAFVTFANGVPWSGAAILGIDHPGVAEIAPRIAADRHRFTAPARWARPPRRASGVHDVEVRTGSRPASGCAVDGSRAGDRCGFELALPGRHHALQRRSPPWPSASSSAFRPRRLAVAALGAYRGGRAAASNAGRQRPRRVEVVDDYAHHPAEGAGRCSAPRPQASMAASVVGDLPAAPLHPHARLLVAEFGNRPGRWRTGIAISEVYRRRARRRSPASNPRPSAARSPPAATAPPSTAATSAPSSATGPSASSPASSS
jgi:UDP-N-acetylmuramate--alanine ligase